MNAMLEGFAQRYAGMGEMHAALVLFRKPAFNKPCAHRGISKACTIGLSDMLQDLQEGEVFQRDRFKHGTGQRGGRIDYRRASFGMARQGGAPLPVGMAIIPISTRSLLTSGDLCSH